LEIQNHHLEEDPVVMDGLKNLSKETGIPLVATNDAHYMKREDAVAQDVLMCIQTQAKVSDEDRMRFENDEFYVKSEAEMHALLQELQMVIAEEIPLLTIGFPDTLQVCNTDLYDGWKGGAGSNVVNVFSFLAE
jgi:DNA polymerase III alpha subunit